MVLLKTLHVVVVAILHVHGVVAVVVVIVVVDGVVVKAILRV